MSPLPVGDQAIPKVTAKSTPEWLVTEGTQMTPSQPTLAQIAMTPKQVGAVVNFSRLLAKQTNAERFVRRELMRTVGGALDVAVLNGSGTNGEPTGLLLTEGVQTQSGTTLNHAGTTAMKRMAAAANVADRPAYVSTDMPTDSMICGDFGNVYVGIWGEAFVLEINPYDPTHFKTGVIQGRIILACDLAVLHAPGFCKSASIT
jgi:hypothetical protein